MDFIEKLKERHKEKVADVEEYNKLAAECPEWKQIFSRIAHDESTHAKMIQHILRVIGEA